MPINSADFAYPDTVPEGALFLAADEPLLIFPSTAAAIKALEPVDVREGTYPIAYGPGGEPYRPVVHGDAVDFERLDGPPRPDDLRNLLLRYLEGMHRTVEPSTSTADLVQTIWAEEAAFWREHDPFGDRFGTQVPLRACLLVAIVMFAIVYFLAR